MWDSVFVASAPNAANAASAPPRRHLKGNRRVLDRAGFRSTLRRAAGFATIADFRRLPWQLSSLTRRLRRALYQARR
jgi:hypothetical protein